MVAKISPVPGALSLRPAKITDNDGYNLVVNRADSTDDNVVISFYSDGLPKGFRDAIGLSPEEARKMAISLIEAAGVVGADE